MKRVLQILIVISIVVALAALAGFLLRFIGYNLSEAFNPLFPHPEDMEAKRQSYLWGIYFLLASVVTVRLFLAYRRNYRRK